VQNGTIHVLKRQENKTFGRELIKWFASLYFPRQHCCENTAYILHVEEFKCDDPLSSGVIYIARKEDHLNVFSLSIWVCMWNCCLFFFFIFIYNVLYWKLSQGTMNSTKDKTAVLENVNDSQDIYHARTLIFVITLVIGWWWDQLEVLSNNKNVLQAAKNKATKIRDNLQDTLTRRVLA